MGSLDTFMPLPVRTEELVDINTYRIAKTVGTGVLNVRKVGLPAIHHGTQGYAKVFRKMLNLQAV